MRIVCVNYQGKPVFGIRGSDRIHLLSGRPRSSFEELAECISSRTPLETTETLSESEVVLLPPVPNTKKIICIGLNYADHAREAGHSIPTYPAVFLRVPTSMVAHDQPLVRPAVSQRFDYEAELGVVIGRRARNVQASDALSYVFGYTCFNDGSLRDYQSMSTQWTMGKNFDASGSVGPDIVTADELPPGASPLKVSTRLNGQVLQSGNTNDMIFTVPKIIQILSEVMTLEPGDLIATGTPAGVGFARKPPIFMKSSDIVEIEIEGIGILRNKIVDEG